MHQLRQFAQAIKQNHTSTRTAKRLSTNAQKINPCLELFLWHPEKVWHPEQAYCFQKIQTQRTALYSLLFFQKGFPKATAAGLRGNIRNTDKRPGGSSVCEDGDRCTAYSYVLTTRSSLFHINQESHFSIVKITLFIFCNLRQFSLWSYCQQLCYTIRITHPSIPPWTGFQINLFPIYSFM